MKYVSTITLGLAGAAGIFAAYGVDVMGLAGAELVGAGLAVAAVSEIFERHLTR